MIKIINIPKLLLNNQIFMIFKSLNINIPNKFKSCIQTFTFNQLNKNITI